MSSFGERLELLFYVNAIRSIYLLQYHGYSNVAL